MTTHSTHEVSQLLAAWSDGDEAALDQLLPLIYRELRQQAERYMRHERNGHVLQTTALVHKAYLRLADCRQVKWQNRAHFFAVAAQMLRRILVEFACAGKADKRDGFFDHVPPPQAPPVSSIEHMRDLLALHSPRPGQSDLRGFESYLLWALAHLDWIIKRLARRDRARNSSAPQMKAQARVCLTIV